MNIKSLLQPLKNDRLLLIKDDEGQAFGVCLTKKTIQKLASPPNKGIEACILPSQLSITYSLLMPKLSSSDTLLAIRSYIEDQLGQEITEDTSIVFLDQRGREQGRTITAVLAQNKTVETWLETHIPLGETVRWYLPKVLCLQAFFEQYGPKKETFFAVDCQPSEVTLLYFQQGSLVASRTLIPQQEGEPSSLSQRIEASLLAWTDQPNTPLVLSGKRESIDLSSLSYPLYTPEETLLPFFDHATLVGAALLSAPSLGVLPPALASNEKRPYLSLWAPLLLLATLLSFSTSFFFIVQEKSKVCALQRYVEENLAFLSKQPWVMSLAKTLPNATQSYDHIEEALEQTKTELKKQALFPLKPALPKLSEVVYLINKQIASLGSSAGAFTIQKLSYTLVQYPTIDQPQKKYQLRIDLEFSVLDPQLARKWHELLLSPNDFIAPRTEVKWSSTGTSYKTSFFIYDTTHYSQVS